MSPRKTTFLYRNGLSIAALAFMFLFLTGQAVTGWKEKNKKLAENGKTALPFARYLSSGHFIQATFENWESEFLQMGMYVLLTISLRQKGSSESKPLDGEEPVEDEPISGNDAPWPVRKKGAWLALYENSLAIAFGLLFLFSFCMHFYGSLVEENEELIAKGKQAVDWKEYIFDSHFWFESFQNWQSEFLAVASIVILSIWLRQKGSPESKAVSAPHSKTGG
jgi:hypothetical protein